MDTASIYECVQYCILVLLIAGIPLYIFFYWLYGVIETLYHIAREKGPEFVKLQKVHTDKELAKIDVHVLEATEAVMKIRARAKSSNRDR